MLTETSSKQNVFKGLMLILQLCLPFPNVVISSINFPAGMRLGPTIIKQNAIFECGNRTQQSLPVQVNSKFYIIYQYNVGYMPMQQIQKLNTHLEIYAKNVKVKCTQIH